VVFSFGDRAAETHKGRQVTLQPLFKGEIVRAPQILAVVQVQRMQPGVLLVGRLMGPGVTWRARSALLNRIGVEH